MGHASTETMAENLQSTISALHKAQIHQLTIDRPSVNYWKLFELICNGLKHQFLVYVHFVCHVCCLFYCLNQHVLSIIMFYYVITVPSSHI